MRENIKQPIGEPTNRRSQRKGAAMLSGHWRNNVTVEQYPEQQPHVKGYNHPTSASEMERLNRQLDYDQERQ